MPSSTILPTNPISSENAAKTKSLCASGMNPNFCSHFPYPLPNMPHPPIASNACWFCRPICLACGSTSELRKYVNLFCMYENLSLTMPAMLPTNNPPKSPPKSIRMIYLILAPAYRHMTNPTMPRIMTVPRSGMSRKRKKNIAFNMMNERKKSFVFTLSRFLISRHHRKSTYPSLKNSAGWMLVSPGMLIHPLAPLSVIPMPGMNTAIWSAMRMIAMMVTFLLLWKNLIGIE